MVGLVQLASVFLKIGFMFFGGGYVLIPLLHRLMVDEYHWLSLKDFVDGVALSQLTPGPLAMLATFAGFRTAGFAGAVVATGAVFLPCTLLMLVIATHYDRFRKIELIRSTLDNVLPAVVGLVAAAAVSLGKTSLLAPPDFFMLAIAFLILQFTRITPMFVILGAGAIGYFFNM